MSDQQGKKAKTHKPVEKKAAHVQDKGHYAEKKEKEPSVEEQQSQINQLEEELRKLNDELLRRAADFDNFRRRALKEREEAHQYGHENLVKDLLPSVDNLDRAIEHARKSDGGDFESMLQGVELVQRELLGALASHGVSEIEAESVAFDPNVHEAMAQREDDSVPVNTVIEVLQKGYRLRDRLLRPARVIVSTRSEGADEGGAEAEEE